MDITGINFIHYYEGYSCSFTHKINSPLIMLQRFRILHTIRNTVTRFSPLLLQRQTLNITYSTTFNDTRYKVRENDKQWHNNGSEAGSK